MNRFLAAGFAASILVFLFLFSNNLFAQSGAPDRTVDEGGGVLRLEYDTNRDGRIDLVVRLDDTGAKLSESIDYNHDGRMDDFYQYNKGVLVSQQVDTNFDGRIDLWVWLADGIYVVKYERDTNFDGKPDVVRVFQEQKSSNSGGGTSN